MAKITAHVKDAIAKGAVNSTPQNLSFEVATNPQTQKGNFISPVVLTNVNHTMATMKEETFGPVMPIMKVSNDDEAIALMNDSDYGLTASVWTKDITRGEELIDRIEAGTVFINRCDYPSPVRYLTISRLFIASLMLILHIRTLPGLVGRRQVWDALLGHGDTMDL